MKNEKSINIIQYQQSYSIKKIRQNNMEKKKLNDIYVNNV